MLSMCSHPTCNGNCILKFFAQEQKSVRSKSRLIKDCTVRSTTCTTSYQYQVRYKNQHEFCRADRAHSAAGFWQSWGVQAQEQHGRFYCGLRTCTRYTNNTAWRLSTVQVLVQVQVQGTGTSTCVVQKLLPENCTVLQVLDLYSTVLLHLPVTGTCTVLVEWLKCYLLSQKIMMQISLLKIHQKSYIIHTWKRMWKRLKN